MKYIYPINAIRSDGYTYLLHNEEDVYKHNHRYGRWNDRDYHSYEAAFDRLYYRAYPDCAPKPTNEWTLRDDWGRNVIFNDFIVRYNYDRYNANMKKIRDIAVKGLPIPRTGTSKAGYKQNAPAKKNSGYHKKIKDAERYKNDVKENNLNVKSRFVEYIDPWY